MAEAHADFCQGNAQDLATVKITGFQELQKFLGKLDNAYLENRSLVFKQMFETGEETRRMNISTQLSHDRIQHLGEIAYLLNNGVNSSDLVKAGQYLDEAKLRRSGYDDGRQNKTVDNIQKQVLDNDETLAAFMKQVLDNDDAAKFVMKQILDNDDAAKYVMKQILDNDELIAAFMKQALDNDDFVNVWFKQLAGTEVFRETIQAAAAKQPQKND